MYELDTRSKRCPRGSFSYVIKSGDTLYKLAIEYNTTVEAIMRINPGINPNNLQIGQRICIPEGGTPTRCPMGTFEYTIKSGDTLYQLAIRYNTTVEAIMRINPGINPNNLQIGQKICIPEGGSPTRCPRGTFEYTIKSGDTLYKLAIEYNTTVEAIMRVNPGIDPNNLQIGQKICIPEGGSPTRCPRGTFEYTIKSGDTLYQLAIEYNTTVEAIMRVNPGIDPNNLQIGQRICIPEGYIPPPPCDGIIYIVRRGDTLYGIAQMFSVPLEALIQANPGVDPNNLMIGQPICIPKAKPPISCPGGTVYTVRANDTMATILLRFNLSVMDLTSANPNVNFDRLMEGQQICIMPHEDMGCACGPGFKSYKITREDIPSTGPVVVAIARKYNISVEELMKANPTFTPSHFKLGQVVCVPK